jgi:hypothetical protein
MPTALRARTSTSLLDLQSQVTRKKELEDFVHALAGDRARQALELAASTAARALRLGVRIDAMRIDADRIQQDSQMWHGFHGALGLYLDSLWCLIAIQRGAPYASSSGVLDTILTFLSQGAMEAYHFGREVLRLREGAAPELGPAVPMDDEDRALLDEHIEDAEGLIAMSTRENRKDE